MWTFEELEVIKLSTFQYFSPRLSILGKPKYLTPLIFKLNVLSKLSQAKIWVFWQVKLIIMFNQGYKSFIGLGLGLKGLIILRL